MHTLILLLDKLKLVQKRQPITQRLSDIPNLEQVAKLVRVCDGSQQPVTVCQFATWRLVGD